MTHPTQSEMHGQHTEWRSDHESWLDDVLRWRIQQSKILDTLARIEGEVREHGSKVLEHASTIRTHDYHLNLHERGIGELQEAGVDPDYDAKTPTHAAWAERHRRAGQTHEQLKHHQRRLLVWVQRLEDR